jgi:hypothetical protein
MDLSDSQEDYGGNLRHYRQYKKPPKHISFIYSKTRMTLLLESYAQIRNLCAIHAKRVTIMQRDMHLARRLRYGTIG